MDSPILVTGGAGFIGSNFIHHWLRHESSPVVNVDCLTYAGNPRNLAGLEGDLRYRLELCDVSDAAAMRRIFAEHRPRAVAHFAAESHVDRSIHSPQDFIRTNVLGTFCLLEAAREHLPTLSSEERAAFRFLHVSTDEVYGSLESSAPPWDETAPYDPRSPYSASKAASDHLVRAYFHTYGLPAIVTNCSNNYGPRQFPEKLIPLMIFNALQRKPLPVYGDGGNVRDWLYVEDHCTALRAALLRGRPGTTYNIGGRSERTNLQVVDTICSVLQQEHPADYEYSSLIGFVKDRPGHDRRYAMDPSKIESELGWRACESFETGIRKTVRWYLENLAWVESVTSGDYARWVAVNYAGRGPK